MSQTVDMTGARPGGRHGDIDVRAIRILALGCALSAFFIVSYAICILGYLLLPGLPVKHEFLEIFLPGFTLLTWYTFFLGLIEELPVRLVYRRCVRPDLQFLPAPGGVTAMQQEHQEQPWWRSPTGIVTIGFLGVAGFFLLTEHTAHVFGALPWLLIAACPLMHLFMHHGHGHGGNNHSGGSEHECEEKQ